MIECHCCLCVTFGKVTKASFCAAVQSGAWFFYKTYKMIVQSHKLNEVILMGRSISICHGNGYLRHNNRRISSKNVDKSRSRFNIVGSIKLLDEVTAKYAGKDGKIPDSKLDAAIVESAYLRFFGEATKEYNQKQKRADRRYDDYYKHLFGCDYTSAIVEEQGAGNGRKSFYELIVQVGNIHDTGFDICDASTIEVIKACLIDYIKQMIKRNPSFKVFNIALHMDEATPHLHIDYIPVADGFSRGQSVQNSLTGALKKLGFNGRDAYKEWLARERDALTVICQEHGIDIEAGVCGGRKERLMVADYKEYQQQHEALQAELDTMQAELDTIADKAAAAESELSFVEVAISEARSKCNEAVKATSLQESRDAFRRVDFTLNEATGRDKEARARLKEVAELGGEARRHIANIKR